MMTATQTVAGGITTNKYESKQFQLGDNETVGNLSHTAGGTDSVLPNFLLVGQIAASRKVVPLAPTATDGSQYPYGFLWLGLDASKTVATTVTDTTLACIIKGKIAAGLISLPSGVTLNDIPTINGTISSGRTVREFLNDRGITLVEASNLLY
jgi:hypothetical protein